MTQKLTRNTNDARWREFWKGVDAAAARAPKLHYQEKKKPDCKEDREDCPWYTRQNSSRHASSRTPKLVWASRVRRQLSDSRFRPP